jgi:hypothetical protein
MANQGVAKSGCTAQVGSPKLTSTGILITVRANHMVTTGIRTDVVLQYLYPRGRGGEQSILALRDEQHEQNIRSCGSA